MNKPKIRSARVDHKIKAAYATLAEAHFKQALAETAMTATNARTATDIRMNVIEDYLERAGAEAAKWRFNP